MLTVSRKPKHRSLHKRASISSSENRSFADLILSTFQIIICPLSDPKLCSPIFYSSLMYSCSGIKSDPILFHEVPYIYIIYIYIYIYLPIPLALTPAFYVLFATIYHSCAGFARKIWMRFTFSYKTVLVLPALKYNPMLYNSTVLYSKIVRVLSILPARPFKVITAANRNLILGKRSIFRSGTTWFRSKKPDNLQPPVTAKSSKSL